jgi:hypothetical protein
MSPTVGRYYSLGPHMSVKEDKSRVQVTEMQPSLLPVQVTSIRIFYGR